MNAQPQISTPLRDRDGRHPLSHDYQWECDQDACGDPAKHEAREAARNSLKVLGAALDLARWLFDRQSNRPVIEPTALARAEKRYLKAREAYRARLVEVTGQDAADLERRLAA